MGIIQISHKMFSKSDYVEMMSARKVQYYHFEKKKRVDKSEKKAKLVERRLFRLGASG